MIDSPTLARIDPARINAMREALKRELHAEFGESIESAAPGTVMRALAAVCRSELRARWSEQRRADRANKVKRVNYLSMEFLMGRALANALDALNLRDVAEAVVAPKGVRFIDVLEQEPDAGLGNGGLGRLAACFLDSLATVGVPGLGYGIRYQFGMFAQRIQDGRQVEAPDPWLTLGDEWCTLNRELHFPVGFGGRVEANGLVRTWHPAEQVEADAYDFVVPGYGSARITTLRLWQARSAEPIDFGAFSRGDHGVAAASRSRAESLNWVLYPDDSTPAGRELRLRQEYFLCSASIQDILARHFSEHGTFDNLPAHAAVHLNDTHPALAVPELMRLLIDVHGLPWEEAWEKCRRIFSYTNHTLLPEALETWPVRMLEEFLPRHLEIIYDINHRFLADIRGRFSDEGLAWRTSLIDESGERRARMAALSIVASHKVNGVSRLHSDLMVRTIFSDYAHLFPGRFINVTNGVTPRRWVAQANPPLTRLLDAQLGTGWRTDLDRLREFARAAGDHAMRDAVLAAKRTNKVALSNRIRRELGINVDPMSLFDVQVKRIHEYKRQLLNVLRVIAHYQMLVALPAAQYVPRTVIFAGKAASAYAAAKNVIRLIHDVAKVVNSDPRVGDRLKVVFVPNYGVSVAEAVIPAADLSEQISTAGTEASGTGNMKFALNGALTIGTWDGANIEIAESVGMDNIFIFGLKAHEVAALHASGYDPRLFYDTNPQLKNVLDALARGDFSPGEPERYRGLVDTLLRGDRYLLLADFAAYLYTQGEVDRAFCDPQAWSARTIHNIAAMGQFSSDRCIREYARDVWDIQPVAR
jgi:starch phosphorylase